ncbi:alpha/beta hydrolase [Thioclava sp. BHET1]|nr:alpha/beta hydrolase [Thioclava sp. BHET1]
MWGGVDSGRRRLMGSVAAFATVAILENTLLSKPAMADETADTKFSKIHKIKAGQLEVAYVDEGPRDGTPVLLLHGWPYDIHSYEQVTAILVKAGYRVVVPYLRGYGGTRFLAQDTPRNAQQCIFAIDAIALMDALQIESAIIGGFDWGARTVNIMAALWPARCKGMVSVSGYLIGSQAGNRKPLPPEAELKWWYQFYFATERGRLGYAENTAAFAHLIWQTASPRWNFGPATFEKSAAALTNPDQVDITINNYRWRIGLETGDPALEQYEAQLATMPKISVPTITMEGDANGAPHPSPASYAHLFTGPYQHRTSTGGIGHNLPQEAPQDFAQAIVDVGKLEG